MAMQYPTSPDSNMLDWALFYSSLGWYVFPTHEPVAPFTCSCGNPHCGKNVGKHPRVLHGLNEASSDPAQLRRWWLKWDHANIAIRQGTISGIITFDFDGDSGLKLFESFPHLETPTVKTGSGGRHLICKSPGPLGTYAPLLSRLPGLDLRGDGGYIVAAPSMARDMESHYEWLIPPTVPPAPVPPWLQELLIEKANSRPKITITNPLARAQVEATPLHQREMQARSYLRACVASVKNSQGYRDNTGMRLATQLRDWALPAELAERLMTEYHDQVEQYGDPSDPYTTEKALVTLRGIYSTPPRDPPMAPPPEDVATYTDDGNADWLLKKYGDVVRYCPERQMWLYWDGKRWAWEDVNNSHLSQMFLSVVVHIQRAETERILGDAKALRVLNAHLHYCRSVKGVDNALKAASRKAAVQVPLDELDLKTYLLNVDNGIVDLRSGQLFPHDRSELLTNLVEIEYDPDATIPEWEETLRLFLPDNTLRDFFQRAWGYSITGQSPDYVFFIHGPTKSGKTTIVRAITSVLGEYNRVLDATTFRRIGNPNPGGHRADLLKLLGARTAWIDETNANAWLNEQLIKQISGGTYITARAPYGRQEVSFLNQAKCWFTINDAPLIEYNDDAMWARLIKIPFSTQVAKDDMDLTMRGLLANIRYSGRAVLAWLVKGAVAYYREGLNPPGVVVREAEQYRTSMNPVIDFVEDAIEVGEGYVTTTSDLHLAYHQWCKHHGQHSQPVYRFSQSLRQVLQSEYPEATIEKAHSRGGKAAFRGIRLNPEYGGGLTLNGRAYPGFNSLN